MRRYVGNIGAVPFDMAVDGSGSVFITGATVGPVPQTGTDYVTLMYDSSGVLQWDATYNGTADNNDTASSIALDTAGNAYVTGDSPGTLLGFDSARDYATIAYGAGGVESWVRRFNGNSTFIDNAHDWATDIAVDDLGNVYVTGFSPADGGTPVNCLTLKYDASGSQLWAARYVGSNSGGVAIEVDGLGNAHVLASGAGATSGTDVVVIKYDAAGQELWARRYNAATTDLNSPAAMALDVDGNVYATGGNGHNYQTLKYSSAGDLIWAATYAGFGGHGASTDIAVDALGNVYVSGSSQNAQATTSDYATVKYDSNGAEQWAARYEGLGGIMGSSGANAIALDESGNVYVTGHSESLGFLSGDGYDYGTVKYNSSGTEQWAIRYVGDGTTSDRAIAIHVDADGNVYVTGQSQTLAGDEILTVKYVQGSNIASEDDNGLSGRFLLEQNYPNPFSAGSTTRISWQAHADAHQSLTVFDMLGREVAVLVDAFLPAGKHEVTLDAAQFPPGVYFYTLAGRSAAKKMTVLR